ncbi:MAG: hypothetical protein IT325_09875 [Anaerolineae bacterium]|nr:hypothetical protein [Anaerolineae bacterium]
MPDFAGFVGDAYTAPSITQDAQATENWYPEVDPSKPQGSRGVVALYPTPGMMLPPWPGWQFPGMIDDRSGPIRGLFELPSDRGVLIILGNTCVLMRMTLFIPNSIYPPFLQSAGVGRLRTSSGPVTITSNGTHCMITDGVDRYAYDIAANTIVRLTDGPRPGGVRCDITDNFMVYNLADSKQWAATSVLSTSTPALSFASTLSSFDDLVALIVDQRQVALLGEQTMEFWSDVGSFPFPFGIIDGTTRQFGCLAPYSVARFGDGFAFLGRDQLGRGVVLYCAHYQIERISTHAIEQDLIGQALNDAFAFTYQLAGHVFYVLQLPTADRTWVYDLSTKMWHRRTSMGPDGRLHRWRVNAVAQFEGELIAGDSESGTLYYLRNDYPWDDPPMRVTGPQGARRAIRRMRCSPHVTRELKRVFFHSLQIQFQPGVGIPSGQGADPQAMLRYSDDGAHTWSEVITTPIGRMGEYQARAIWRRLGAARDRVFEVSVTDPVYAPIISANLEFSEGAS